MADEDPQNPDELTEAQLEALTAPDDGDGDAESDEEPLNESDTDDGADEVPEQVLARDEELRDVPRPKQKAGQKGGETSQWTAAQVADHFNRGNPKPSDKFPWLTWQDAILLSGRVNTPTISMVTSLADIDAHPDMLGPNTPIFFKVVRRKMQAAGHPFYDRDTSDEPDHPDQTAVGAALEDAQNKAEADDAEAERQRELVAAEVEERRARDADIEVPLMGEELLATFIPSEGEDPNDPGVRPKYAQLVSVLNSEQCDDLVREIVKMASANNTLSPANRDHFARVLWYLILKRPDFLKGRNQLTDKKEVDLFSSNGRTLSDMLLSGLVSLEEYVGLDLTEDPKNTRAWLKSHAPLKSSTDDQPEEKKVEETSPTTSGDTTDQPMEETPSAPDVVVVADDTPGLYDQDGEVDVAQVDEPEGGVEETPPVADDDQSGQTTEPSDDEQLLAELDSILDGAREGVAEMAELGFRA